MCEILFRDQVEQGHVHGKNSKLNATVKVNLDAWLDKDFTKTMDDQFAEITKGIEWFQMPCHPMGTEAPPVPTKKGKNAAEVPASHQQTRSRYTTRIH